jgi:hypothetical protein
MIRTRIASAATIFTFGLAALGGTLAMAAPATAEAVPAPGSAATQAHVPFPKTGHEPHERFGRKGADGMNAAPMPQDLIPIIMGTVKPRTTHH